MSPKEWIPAGRSPVALVSPGYLAIRPRPVHRPRVQEVQRHAVLPPTQLLHPPGVVEVEVEMEVEVKMMVV